MQFKLLKLRKEHGLKQDELGKILGMKPGAYGRMERGERNVTLKEMIAVHQYFGIPKEEIFLPPNCILNAENKKEDV